MIAAIREICAVAALVAHERMTALWAGRKYVDNRHKSGTALSYVAPSVATLPPSQTTSGLMGQRSWKVTEVVLQGDKSPGGAIGDQPFHVGFPITDFSVHAPTVSAFHAWAGSWTASRSLRPR